EEERARRRLYRTSVLDQVLVDADALHGRLSTSDRLKVDEYMTGVRELEQRIEDLANEPLCAPGARPGVSSEYTYPEHLAVMHELMVTAMQCDLTRYLTFMNGNASSQRQFTFLGVSGGHHDIRIRRSALPPCPCCLGCDCRRDHTCIAHLYSRCAPYLEDNFSSGGATSSSANQPRTPTDSSGRTHSRG
ncbi:MAG: DUF1552 domain-containing protein, partial [Candidatus Poribacteria bacterium]